jgi:hypothetical protein
MSGPEDTRETAASAGTSGVPADPAPPSFGGGDGESTTGTASGGPAAEPAPLRLPAFGLQAPWWAAESEADAAPEPAATAPAPTVDVPAPAAKTAAPEPETTAPEPEAETAAETAPPEVAPTEPAPAGASPGTLVAGAGVPSVDSRGAVPAEPLVKPPVSTDDTDPDGFTAVRPEGAAPEDDTAKDDTTVDNPAVNEAAEGGPASLSAFEKAKEAESAASAQTAVLVPDAILPPGVVPPTGSGPFPHTETADGATAADGQIPVIAPVYHTEGGVPLDTPPPPGTPPAPPKGASGGANKRRTVLIGGGAALVLAAGAALFALGGTGSSDDKGEAAEPARPSAAPAPSSAAPAPPSPTPTTAALTIDNEKSDTKDLAFRDVFPQETLKLGGRTYIRDRWSLNRDVKYAARGAMLTALQQYQCRKIVRATFIDRKNKLAVTSGIAVMPTKDAAIAVSRAGDPAKYEWFRGMAGKHSPDIDRAGGYAAATVRGRYVAYAYVQWANGKKAEPGDPVIKQAAQRFLDYDLRPIMARARG